MKSIIIKIFILLFFLSFRSIAGTNSYFTDSEKVTNNSIGTGTWDNSIHPKDIVINEVYYDVENDGSKGTENKNEWIELYNNTDKDLLLKDWYLEDGQGNIKIIHPQIAVIPAYGFLVLSHDNTTWVQYWSIPSGVPTINLTGGSAWLNNDGDKLMLKNPMGQEIDFVAWENFVSSWNLVANEGQSIARKVKGVDTDNPTDWNVLSEPNPGTNPHPPLNQTKPTINFSFREDKKAVGFHINNVPGFVKLIYTITYDTDTGNKGISGEIPINGLYSITRDKLVLGTCSENEGLICVYDTGITSIKLQVTLVSSDTTTILEQEITN